MNENQVRERMAKLIVDTPSSIVSKNCTDDALLVLVAVDIADHLIANGVTIRERGEWEIVIGSNGKEKMVCTNCRHQQDLASTFTYCPNCGADMRGMKNA